MKKIFLTCLLVCTMVLTMCMTSFASSGFNIELPDNPYPECDSFIVINNPYNKKYVCAYYQSAHAVPIYDSYFWNSGSGEYTNKFYFEKVGSTDSSVYFSEYGYGESGSKTWSSFSSKKAGNSSTNVEIWNSRGTLFVVDSNKTIYDKNGNEVFQWTPPLTMAQKVILSVEEALVNLLATVGGVMKVLLLCGVGCLALLMGLKLFGKVFPTFRV